MNTISFPGFVLHRALRRTLIIASLSGLLFASNAAAAIVYDATADFSIAPQPANSVWTYGFLDATGVTFTAYTTSTASWHANPNLDGWSQFLYDSGSYSVVGINPTASVQFESGGGSIAVDPGTLFTHPGNSGEKGTIRFTAPADGTIDISAFFGATDTAGGNRDVHVYINGVDQIPGSFVIGSKTTDTPVNYASTEIPVVAGTTVDFATGYGSDLVYFNDATTLQAVVTFVPEPGSLLMLGLGAAGMLAARRRRVE